MGGHRRIGRRRGGWTIAAVAWLSLIVPACERPADVPEARGSDPVHVDPDIERVRKARAALAAAGIPLYPGAAALDATEFVANTAPFITVDFFTTDPPEPVIAFYDRELERLTARRDTTIEEGGVRYEFQRAFSGVAVRPWDPRGADSAALAARFDRRDVEGVTTAELDAYGKFLTQARTQVVVNVPRPESR